MPKQEVDDFFNTLYEKTKDEILMYIIAKCEDTKEISDIFQEIYMEIVKLLKKKGIAYFKHPEAIVMKIAKRKLYQHFTFQQKLEVSNIRYEQLENIEEELKDFEDFTLDDAMVSHETIELVHEILEKQDILTRKIFFLEFYIGVSLQEITEILEISEEMVKNRLYGTLKSIKRELEKGFDNS